MNTDDDDNQAAERFVLRMPPGMRRRIADRARENSRSMNSEIVAALQAYLEGGGGGGINLDDRLANALAGAIEIGVNRVLDAAPPLLSRKPKKPGK